VGRDKDRDLVFWLWEHEYIDSELVAARLAAIPKTEKAIIRSSKTFREIFKKR